MSFRNSPSHGPNHWSKEDTASLIRLWEEGKSGGEIGKTINKGRSACCAKVYRLRLAGHVFKRRHEPQPERGAGSARDRPRANASGLWRAPKPAPKAKPPRPMPEPTPLLDATHAKPWTERKFAECAFPISGEGADTLSCCAPTSGHTYCRAHRKVMYAPLPATAKNFVRGAMWAARAA